MSNSIEQLESQLNDFNPQVRSNALAELVELERSENIHCAPTRPVANMHCHTFFSFNAYGYSPSALAWLGKHEGYEMMGIVDFDVLDGVDEFLKACDAVGLRGTAGIETRIYVPEFSTREINSPGEPGIYYHMGIGFTSTQTKGAATSILKTMRERAMQRNQAMINRLNNYLQPVTVDYSKDVLPLTPNGTATERHLLVAYKNSALRSTNNVAEFWAEKLKMPLGDVQGLMKDDAAFQNTMRAKLMKRGGVGYAQPDAGEFPDVEEVNNMTLDCDALPCATWLDGFSAGEQAMEELLEMLIPKGIVAMNIIPDRNWNIPDPELRKAKVTKLYEAVDLAKRLDLPLNIGTEMNAFGQKHVDDFEVKELAPVREAFIEGAHFVYGHTFLQRALGLGFQSDWAQHYLPARKDRNAFYTQIGQIALPGEEMLRRTSTLSTNLDTQALLKKMQEIRNLL